MKILKFTITVDLPNKGIDFRGNNHHEVWETQGIGAMLQTLENREYSGRVAGLISRLKDEYIIGFTVHEDYIKGIATIKYTLREV